jgi:hypothetical protein
MHTFGVLPDADNGKTLQEPVDRGHQGNLDHVTGCWVRPKHDLGQAVLSRGDAKPARRVIT